MNTITATAEIAEADEYITITYTISGEELTERYFFAASEAAATESDVDQVLAEGAPFSRSAGSPSWRRVGPIDGRFFAVESIESIALDERPES